MASPAFQGTPCLVPVQLVFSNGSERRGFITRLSPLAAAVSSDPGLGMAEPVTLRFKRPADGQEVECVGVVSALLPEGGLWRGRPAALVAFDAPAELDEGDAGEALSDAIAPSSPGAGTDGEEAWGEGPALTDSLRSSGLGRRKLAGRMRAPNNPFAQRGTTPGEPPPPGAVVSSGSPPAHGSARDIEASFFDDEPTAPPTRRQAADLGDEAAAHEGPLPTAIGFGEFFDPDDATVPPGGQTDPALPQDGFFGQFGNLGGVPSYSLPPGMMDSSGEFPGDLLGDLPDEAISPTTAPAAHRPRPRGDPPESTVPSPQRPSGSARFAESSEVPPVQAPRNRQAAPPGTGRPPWEEMREDRAALSLIPRNARIASTLDVHFWARGRRHHAVADNFSREGLFLTFPGTPPVRGAIVRVEFPLEGDDESVPVRFNAEVRWHRSDRPGAGLADGFGVQILTFETPKDRARYGELLMAILALGPAPDPVEAGFSWGKQGGR